MSLLIFDYLLFFSCNYSLVVALNTAPLSMVVFGCSVMDLPAFISTVCPEPTTYYLVIIYTF